MPLTATMPTHQLATVKIVETMFNDFETHQSQNMTNMTTFMCNKTCFKVIGLQQSIPTNVTHHP